MKNVLIILKNWEINEQRKIGWVTLTPDMNIEYRQTTNISHTLVSNKIIDISDVVGASPVGVAPTTSSFST